jgi:uncharacterized protein (DUF433 family)
MKRELLDRIELNPDVMLGKPVIKGTRLPVEIILEKLAFGATQDEILKDYPFLSREDIKAALYYAAKTISMEEEYALA